MTLLHITPHEGHAYEFELSDQSVVVGRSQSADLVVADRFLSRKHAEFFPQGDRWMVRDLGSRNGTRVNGRTIEGPTALADGDRVEISATALTLVSSSSPPVVENEGSLSNTVFIPANELLDRYASSAGPEAERLRILHQVHEALAGSIELDELLDLVLDRAFDHLRPQQGSVLLADPAGGWQRRAGRKTESADDYLYSETLVKEVAENGMAALVLDLATDQKFGGAESILASGIRSLIAAPLLCPEGSLGLIALSSTASERSFEESDLELLSSLASVAALRIWSLSLAEDAAERRRLEGELELARRIQKALLPERLPRLAGLELEAVNVPSRGVSGDLYQVVPRQDGRCAVFLADVSGKGMAASILTATIEALAAIPIREGLSPDAICARVGRHLEERTPAEKFATAFLAVVDPETGELTYANAGHNPTLWLRRDGSVERLERTGLPLGLLADATYEGRTIRLQPGDTVVAYSDGYTEAADPSEEEYGLDRLQAVCLEHRSASPGEIVAAVEADLEAFVAGEPYADDRTLIVLRRVD